MATESETAMPTLAPMNVHVGDARRLPFPSDHFDLVREDRVLQHLAEPPEEVIREMVRVAKPAGGLVACCSPEWRSLRFETPSAELAQLTARVLDAVGCLGCMPRENLGALARRGRQRHRRGRSGERLIPTATFVGVG